MRWIRPIIIFLALLQAGWMAFDGARALVIGDYVTATSGEYAGQLGAWSRVVSAFGIEPRSTLMKGIFVIYGVGWLIAISSFAKKDPWSWLAMLIAAIGSLWYLPIGTVSALIQIALLVVMKREASPETNNH